MALLLAVQQVRSHTAGINVCDGNGCSECGIPFKYDIKGSEL